MKKSIGAKTLLQPHPVLVVGSYDPDGRPNIMTAAWGGICCSVPPCVAVSLRKATYSYDSIMSRGAFTVNIVPAEMVAEADYCGIASGRDQDKFSKINITPVKSDLVDAPYGEEFPFILECKLLKSIEIGLHTQFIGEIMDIKADPEILGEDGKPDIKKIDPIIFDPGTRNYWSVGKHLGKAFSIGKDIN